MSEQRRQSDDLGQKRATRLDWRRNLYVVWLGELLAIAGFSAAMPFMPYYIQELGVTSAGQVELWSGLLSSAGAWTMGIMSPIWGSLADRLGRKLMLARALFGGAVLVGAMGFVSNVNQLLVLRLLQGAVTGTVAAAYTLVVAGTPAEQRGFALGMVQMGVYLGASLGPTLGGFAVDCWGYRACFVLTGVLMAAGGVVVATLVRETRTEAMAGKGDSLVDGLRLVLRSPGILSVFGMRFVVSSALRMVNPMLPLFVQALVPSQDRIASLTGLINSASMVTTAVGTLVAARYADRVGARKVLLVCLVSAALCYFPQAMVANVTQLVILKALAGLAVGGVVSALSAALARAAPEGRQGAVFGLQSSVHSAANAVGPMLGGALAASWGLRVPFLAAGLGFALASSLLVMIRPRRE